MMPIKVWTRTLVVRLSRAAFFRFFFGLYYRAAWLIFSRAARFLFPETLSIKLHRGYSTREWEPGISDIDAVLEIRELTPAENARFISRWRKFYNGLKVFFPVLGETIVASRAEQELYYAWGDIRAAERTGAPGQERTLSGIKTALDLWTEGLHAHTQLCKLAISLGPVPAPVAGRAVRKFVLDVARHSAAYRRSSPPPAIKSRLETEKALDEYGDIVPPQLRALISGGGASATDAALKRAAQLACAHTANILEQDAASLLGRLEGFTVPAPAVKLVAPPPEEDAAAMRIGQLLEKRLGGFFSSAVFDNVSSSFVVLNGVPGCADDLACGISILDSMTEWYPSMRGTIFPLGPGSLCLMGLGPYDDDPLKMGFPPDLRLEAASYACLQSGEAAPFSAHRRTFFRTGEIRRLSPCEPLLGAMYRESLSHFLRTWRTLLEPGQSGAVYAVSRAAALWLYFVKRMPQPCFPLEPLLEAFKNAGAPEDRVRVLETTLSTGLRPEAIEIISALNAETLAAAAAQRAA